MTVGETNSTLVIAPIGNDANPFKGVFDGNGKTISNLVVTTNKSALSSSDPANATAYAFSNAVGFFGMTAEGSEIKNFILNDPVVEVASGTTYYTEAKENIAVAPQTAGLAIGYVAGNASYIGVYGGTLAVRVAKYTTKNSIVGYMNVKASGDEGDGDSDGDDEDEDNNKGYFIPDKLATSTDSGITLIKSGNTLNKYCWLVPDSLNKLQLGSFSYATSYKGNDEFREVEVKSFTFYKNYTESSSPSTKKLYTSSSDLTISLTEKYTDDTTDDYDQYSIQQNVKDENAVYTELNYCLYTQNSASATSSNFTVVSESKTSSTTENVYYGTDTYNINDSGIKVKISSLDENGKAQIFVIASVNTDNTRYLGLYKVYTPTNSKAFASVTYKDFSAKNGTLSETAFTKNSPLQALKLPGKDAVGCYFEVDSIGIYQLSSTSSAIRIHYLSVVGVDDGQENTDSTTTGESNLATIDFVKESATLSESDESNYAFSSTNATGILVVFELSENSAIVLYFMRPANNTDNGETISVRYYLTGTGAPNNYTKIDLDALESDSLVISSSGAEYGYKWSS